MKILLLGAKSAVQPLNAVPDELRSIKQLFKTRQQKLEVEYEPYLDMNILGELLREFTDQLDIMHFAGHSSAEQFLTDKEAVYTLHIASILQTWATKPRLLFLNGCNSAGQVKAFHAAGIPCVIATRKPIDDQEATRFAHEFYANLLAQPDKTTWQDAFDRAGALTLMNQRRSPRSLDLEAIEPDAQEWDWGIYPAPGRDDFLQTSLFPSAPPPPDNFMIRIHQTKLDNAQARWMLISDWLVRVLKQYDTETRESEKIRMEAGIQEKQAELVKIEAEVAGLSEKLAGFPTTPEPDPQ